MTPVWVRELADAFWAAVGPEVYPRTFAEVSLGFRVIVIERANLSLAVVRDWLTRQSRITVGGPDRRLRGCLVAHEWDGFVFVEATDPPAERRFTLAHELAHYLRDVWRPRRRAMEKLGTGIVDVLDGKRPPTADERLHAVLRGLPAGPVMHLLGRGEDESPEVRAAEAAADRLAFELLAPAAEVREPAELEGRFGLPPAKAIEYARLLWPPAVPNRLLAALGG